MRLAGALLFTGLCAVIAQSGCGTTAGNPQVSVEFKSYATASSGGFGIPFIAPAYAALSEVKLCFKRVRFKFEGASDPADSDDDPDNMDFAIGEVALQSGGTSIGTVELVPGVYKRVEFDLDSHCASGKSVQVTNSNGSFSTADSVEIKFNGSFSVDARDRTVRLNIQPILTQLDSVNSASQIKTVAEASEGDFED